LIIDFDPTPQTNEVPHPQARRVLNDTMSVFTMRALRACGVHDRNCAQSNVRYANRSRICQDLPVWIRFFLTNRRKRHHLCSSANGATLRWPGQK